MRRHILFGFTAVFLISSGAGLAVGAGQERTAVQVSLLSDATAVQPGDSFTVGIRFKMDPGWHIYWRNPGDAGLAPTVSWELPKELEIGELLWPVPEQVEDEYITSYGYSGEVVLLATAKVSGQARLGGIFEIRANVHWLQCRLQCIPGKADVRMNIPIAERTLRSPKSEALFKDLFARIPQDFREEGHHVKAVEGTSFIELSIDRLGEGQRPEYFFPYRDDWMKHHSPITVEGENGKWKMMLPLSGLVKDGVGTVEGILTVSGGANGEAFRQAYEMKFHADRSRQNEFLKKGQIGIVILIALGMLAGGIYLFRRKRK